MGDRRWKVIEVVSSIINVAAVLSLVLLAAYGLKCLIDIWEKRG